MSNVTPLVDETTTSGLPARLAHCAKSLGGKRALAKAAGLSEAQLFRYLNNESDMAVSRLTAIASAANVCPAWLLTGEDIQPPPPRPDFNPATMAKVIQTLEEYMFEYAPKFTPKQRGQLAALAYEALRHDQHVHNIMPDWSRENMFNILDFASALKKHDELKVYHTLFEKSEISHTPLSTQEMLTLDRLVKIGAQGLYNGIGGKMYFDRMGHTLSPTSLQNLLSLVELVSHIKSSTPLKWLDAGCGNGRYMLALTQHAPHIKTQGLDPSSMAATEIQQLIRSKKLAEDCFTQAELRSMPYESNSFDMVYARNSLCLLPLLDNRDSGMRLAVKEIHRVLKAGGLCHIVVPNGQGRHWVPFWQYCTEQEIIEVLTETGLSILNHRVVDRNTMAAYSTVQGADYTPPLRESYHVITARKNG